MATRRKMIVRKLEAVAAGRVRLTGAAAPLILTAKKHQRAALAADRAAAKHYRMFLRYNQMAASERVLRDKALVRAMKHKRK